MPTVLLIRHGDNPVMNKRLAGRTPGVHLNDKGKQQADTLAESLASAPIKVIYSSPMERALETAAPLAQRLGLEVQICQGFIELDYGNWAWRTFKQLQRIKLWKTVHSSPAEVCFPGGESFVQAQARAVAEVDQVLAGCGEDDLVAIFTHGDIVRLLVAYYLEMPLNAYNKLGINTASITVLYVSKEGRVSVPHINQIMKFEIKPKEEKPKESAKRNAPPR